jgi:hypothetical protein
MVFLKNNILLFILLLLGVAGRAQSFSYNYIDPCTKASKTIDIPATNGTFPILITYYGQSQAFTPQQLNNGTFSTWMNTTYTTLGKNNPCDQIGFTTVVTNVTNVANIVINNILALNSLINSTVSNSSVGVGAVSNATEGKDTKADSKSDEKKDEAKSEDKKEDKKDDNNNNGGGNGGDKPSGGTNKTPDDKPKENKQEEIDKGKAEENKQTSSSTTKAVSSSSKTERSKPSVMLTGDIVGMQRATDNTQDSKVTASYIRMRGDGKTSWGISSDFTIRAQLGNITLFKSWITTKTARKHIDLISNSVSILPNTFTNTSVFIRIDNLKKVTWLYGIAGSYGQMYGQPLSAGVLIGGGMFRGKITKKIDAVIIVATVYVPYMKYYTEEVFQAKPMLIPFFNLNYAISKTFKIGLTGGTTYSVTQSILNYQLLMGAKLTL